MNNLPLQPLVWETPLSGYIAFALSATNGYKIYADNTKYKLEYRLFGNAIREETGFATIDEAKSWAWNHYNEKMQPYVKPMPTKVYELTYDYGDGYFTVFMTLDKQLAVDFMESVKNADLDFIASYGIDCGADELLIEQYDDNHPLKPYRCEVFKSIYEDSFSEWMLNYGGSSFVSSLDIIEHELFGTVQNNKGE